MKKQSMRLKRPLGTERTGPAAPAQTPNKLYVAMPCYGGMLTHRTLHGMIRLFLSLQMSGIRFSYDFPGNESLITRARNRIVAKFMKTDCTHLLFVDADVGFDERDVQALMAVDEDVVIGAYPKKGIGWESIRRAANEGAPSSELPGHGALFSVNANFNGNSGEVAVFVRNGVRFIEVLDGSTGFMLIRRQVLERYIQHYEAEIAYVVDDEEAHGQTAWNVFHAGIDPLARQQGELPRYLSEDYLFCRKWQAMGGKVHMAMDVKLTHTGTYTFTGDVMKFLEPAPEQQPDGEAPDVKPAA